MTLFKRTIEEIKRKREKILNGGFNCIPWGFDRFEEIHPGIEQKKYYLVTANSKVGKSQICDYLFMHNAYTFAKSTDGDIKVKIFYFSLEMDSIQKMYQNMSHRMYIDSGHKVRVSPMTMRSPRKALAQEIVDLIDEYQPYYEEFEDSVQFITDIRNPYGIYKYMEEYALANGKVHMKKIMVDERNPITKLKTGNRVEKLIADWYEPNNPDEYVIGIFDHASLLTPEEQSGKSLFGAINDFSSRHCVMLRNKYGIIPVLIQQQASSQESIENFKYKKLKPTFTGLADCKNTQRDIDLALGLFTPARHEMPTFSGYDINYFNDNIRFMDIIGGREGGGGNVVPLYFDGAVNYFKELPKVKDAVGMQAVYNKLSQLRGKNPIAYQIPEEE